MQGVLPISTGEPPRGVDPMAHTYFVMREPGKEVQALVWDTRTLSIGRSPENDLTLEDVGV